jgi:hypothetical protein
MKYRLIDQKTAEWIGMAASVAGGWIAVDMHLAEISAADAECYPIDSDGMRHYSSIDPSDPAGDEEFPLHPLGSGNLIAYGPPIRRQRLLMCVPDTAGLAEEGEAAPQSLVEELRPKLEAAGYNID